MKIRSRFMALIMALALMLPISAMALVADDYYGADGVFADVGILPMAAVSGYTVTVYNSSGPSSSFTTTTLSSGGFSYYSATASQSYGYYITIPANTSPGYLDVIGLYPIAVRVSSPTNSWVSGTISTLGNTVYFPPYDYLLTSSISPFVAPYMQLNSQYIQSQSGFGNLHIYIPAHTNTLYLVVGSSGLAGTDRGGAMWQTGGTITFTPDSSNSTLSSMLTALNAINTNTSNSAARLNTVNTNLTNLKTSVDGTNTRIDTTNTRLNTLNTTNTNGFNNVNTSVKQVDTSVNNFMKDQQNKASRKFEDGYFENLGKQIDKAEDALTPANSALPNGGDVGGFTSDLSDGLGLSGSSFNASDFNEATGGFTGADSTGAGGPWEFFTQAVADDLSGDSPMGIDLDDDFIMVWFVQSEGRYGLWSNQSSKDTK